jgi:3-deoxy-D-manno-octulosonic-acid transferase
MPIVLIGMHMAIILYNTAILFLYPFYLIVSLYNPRLKHFRRTRSEGIQSLENFVTDSLRGSPVWLHASSVGELDQALAISRAIKKNRALQQVIISIFSTSAKPKQHPDADLIFYLPLDFFWTWGKIIRQLKPRFFATMTWDVFPNLLFHLNQSAVPAYMANAALEKTSWRLKDFYKTLLKSVYARFTGIGCADEASRELFLQLLPDESRVLVTGDSRYDSILHKINQPARSRSVSKEEAFIKNIPGKVMIFGSTYDACDRTLFPLLNDLLLNNPGWTPVIFPHHINEERLHELESNARLYSLNIFKLSEIISNGTQEKLYIKIKKSEKAAALKLKKNQMNIRIEPSDYPPVIIADVMGVLAHAYRYSEIAYVGGGFHFRIHNTGEPAALENAVLTGPMTSTSPIALVLEEEKGLIKCLNGPDFYRETEHLMRNTALRNKTGKAAGLSLKSRAGASDLFLKMFKNY